ncbi:MAG: type II 3-dehydroquinate dehydratase [Clostridia bacterium]|nr:type II 3-dehydroquinate dehydratase [Clostridia bacterium]
MRLLVLNGPNLQLLGLREPEIYGRKTLSDLESEITEYCKRREIEVDCYQSNHEGDLVDRIGAAYGVYDGIILNPAAYTHTSIAIADAVKGVSIPTVEVHLSDVDSREEFRKISFVRPNCIKTISGKGFAGYLEAVDVLAAYQ